MSIAEKLEQIAENEQKVYDAGKSEMLNIMWDAIQMGGARVYYRRVFQGKRWTNEIFKPLYTIKANDCAYMFQDSGLTDGELIRNVDFSKADEAYLTFYNAKFTTLPTLDFSNCTAELTYTFWSTQSLTKIELIKLSESGTSFHADTFIYNYKLTSVRFSGIIKGGINFKHSPLDKESIENVFSCLSDTVSGKTATFKKSAVNKAFETSEGAADGANSQAWTELIATKSNWTISLV